MFQNQSVAKVTSFIGGIIGGDRINYPGVTTDLAAGMPVATLLLECATLEFMLFMTINAKRFSFCGNSTYSGGVLIFVLMFVHVLAIGPTCIYIEDVPKHEGPNLAFADFAPAHQISRPDRLAKHPAFGLLLSPADNRPALVFADFDSVADQTCDRRCSRDKLFRLFGLLFKKQLKRLFVRLFDLFKTSNSTK